jgi:hypothetical protein
MMAHKVPTPQPIRMLYCPHCTSRRGRAVSGVFTVTGIYQRSN